MRFLHNYIFPILIDCLLLTASCQRDKINSVNDLVFVKEITDRYDKGIYINRINDIHYHDGNYFIVDPEIGSVFVFDKNYMLIKQIGKKGRGPHEYDGIVSVYVTDEHIFISDYSLNLIDTYDRKSMDFVERIKFTSEMHVPLGDFYADDDNIFILNSLGKDYCDVVSYDSETKQSVVIHNFKLNPTREIITYVKFKNKYSIGILSSSNKVKIFSLEEKKIIDELEIPLPEKTIKEWEKWVNDNNNPPLFIDAYVSNKILYLCFQDLDLKKMGLAKVKLDNDFNIISIHYYYFNQHTGDNIFCINDKKVVSFAWVSSYLQEYKIPN
jgi:hypothetical protein